MVYMMEILKVRFFIVGILTVHTFVGLGHKRGRDDDWIAGQEEFNDLLANLNSNTVPSTTDDSSCHIKGIVPHSPKRVL